MYSTVTREMARGAARVAARVRLVSLLPRQLERELDVGAGGEREANLHFALAFDHRLLRVNGVGGQE